MTLPTGSMIAGYTIERQLGAGGMGTVYLARHPTLPRSDAVKVLSAELSADDQFRARFRREADLAASLDHPNIVRVYTRGETEDGRLWIAMQFVDGTDAGAVLEDGPVPPERTAHIITQVGKALDYAHSRNLLHRDIKPANFLLAGPVGPYERVLLADFGIARALDDATRLTATGAVMATVAYASPESVEGKPLDHRSDLYSLGCALYRLLTNRTPYQGIGAMSAVMMAHVLQPPPRATEFAPWLPPGIDAVLAAAMAKDPNARYQSARELAAATEAALLGGHPNPVPAATPSPQQWMTERTQTYPSGYFTGPYPHAQPPMPAAPAKRRRRWWLAGAAAALVAAVVAAFLLVPRGGPDAGPYPAQTFVHTFGITRIDHRPGAVATLGPGDADVALSLGVQPVALVAAGARLPSWLADLVHGSPTVLARPDATALAGAHPDLVIDTDAALTQQGYDTLNGVAPTISRPNTTGQGFGPRVQLSWIAGILGQQSRAGAVQNEANTAQAAVRAAHPAVRRQDHQCVRLSPIPVCRRRCRSHRRPAT